ncbi:hypothetical protein Tco_1047234 [Tanacetum coccineum]
MAEKVHQEKLQGVQTRLTYGESSHRNSQTQFSESESCDRKKRLKKRKQSPTTASRGTCSSQTTSAFSRLRHERDKPTRRRSPVSATVFTRLGPRDKDVFTRFGERKRSIHSRLGPDVAPRHMHASRKRNTSRSAENPSRRRKDARELIQSYITCSSERQQEIEQEWDAADRASRRPHTRNEERYHLENDHDMADTGSLRSIGQTMKMIYPNLGCARKLISLRQGFRILSIHRELLVTKEVHKRPCGNPSYQAKGGEPTEAFMEIFKAESMHVSGAPKCMRILGFIHGITNPDLIQKLNDNIPKSVDEMMSITTAFLRGEVVAANQSKKKVPPTWKHHETSHRPNFDKRLDFKSQHISIRRKDHFTPLMKTPKEILAMETVKFKAPPPMTGLAENRNKNKFCEFHGDKGHSTDECIHLRKHIEEVVKSEQLSHFVKEIKQGGKRGEQKNRKERGSS